MPAGQAGICVHPQLAVMIMRHRIPGKRQVVILVHQADINTGLAGLAVVAIHAIAHRRTRRKCADHRVVVFFPACLQKGQQSMRRLLEPVFAEGNRLGVPVILDTDAASKCDKYVHLGMELAGTRRFGEYGVLYDLIKYPDPSEAGEKRRNAE